MKEKITGLVCIIIWLVCTVIIGKYLNQFMHNVGANIITVDDVVGCYILPCIIIGFILFMAWFNIKEKK